MIPFNNLSVLDSAFSTPSQRLTAAALVATVAALVIAATWLASSLIGGTSPATVAEPAAHQALYPDQGLRQPAAVPVAESYPDQGLRQPAAVPVAESNPDQGLRQPAAVPVAESYPDQGLRQPAAVPVAHEDYLDFGQRHAPTGSER